MEDTFLSHFPPRLIEERKRLGLTQSRAAELCDVRREAWGQYERGQVAPGAQVLFRFAAAGADMGYLMTGSRIDAALGDDRDRLALAIEAVEEGLEAIGRKLDPEKKARLILAAFDLMAEPDQAKNKVVELIRLVA